VNLGKRSSRVQLLHETTTPFYAAVSGQGTDEIPSGYDVDRHDVGAEVHRRQEISHLFRVISPVEGVSLNNKQEQEQRRTDIEHRTTERVTKEAKSREQQDHHRVDAVDTKIEPGVRAKGEAGQASMACITGAGHRFLKFLVVGLLFHDV